MLGLRVSAEWHMLPQIHLETWKQAIFSITSWVSLYSLPKMSTHMGQMRVDRHLYEIIHDLYLAERYSRTLENSKQREFIWKKIIDYPKHGLFVEKVLINNFIPTGDRISTQMALAATQNLGILERLDIFLCNKPQTEGVTLLGLAKNLKFKMLRIDEVILGYPDDARAHVCHMEEINTVISNESLQVLHIGRELWGLYKI